MSRIPKQLLFALAAIAVAYGIGWYLHQRASQPATPTASTDSPAAPSNPAHELAALEAQREKNPDHPPILFRLAELHRQAGKHKEAIAVLEHLVKVEPKLEDAYIELGKARFEAGDLDGAIATTRQVLDFAPNQPDALYNLGALYGNQGQDAKAREFFDQAVKADPNSESAKLATAALKQLSQSPGASAVAHPSAPSTTPSALDANSIKQFVLPFSLPGRDKSSGVLPPGHPVIPPAAPSQ